MRCKRVVAQEFSQRPEIVIRNTSLCGGSINFQVSLVWQQRKRTESHWNNEIYVKDPKEYKLQEAVNPIRIWTARSSKC